MSEHYALVARQLIRAVRGRRSQADLSRRIGYRSNMVQRWEAGECAPSAARFLHMCARQRVDVQAVVVGFYGRKPDWLRAGVDATSAEAVAQLLSDQKGRVPLLDLARRTGYSRYALSRWFRGHSEPRLTEFLHVLDICGQRLLDFVALLTDPERMPALRADHRRLERARSIAYEQPWSHAVLRALELERDERAGWKSAGWLARRLGCDERIVERALAALADSGQVEQRGRRYRVQQVLSVNTGRDPARARSLKLQWGQEALARLSDDHPGLYGYNLFAVSRRTLRELRDLQLEYVRAMEALVAASDRDECVGLYCVQLLDLDTGAGNALRAPRESVTQVGKRRRGPSSR